MLEIPNFSIHCFGQAAQAPIIYVATKKHGTVLVPALEPLWCSLGVKLSGVEHGP